MDENKKTKTKKQDKELYWILGVMVGLIAIFLLSSTVIQYFNKVEYEGMTFTKEKVGEIDFFKYYYVTDRSVAATGRVIDNAPQGQVVLYLRTDPRENYVPVEGGEISLKGGKTVYIGIGDDLGSCKYSQIAVATVTSFMAQNGFKTKAGLLNGTEAQENNLPYVQCSTYPENPVIIFQKGNETSVKVINENCYEITTTDSCDILPAAEKFVVQTIVDAKESQ